MKVRLILSVLLGVVCLWLAVRGIDFKEFLSAFETVHWGPVFWLLPMLVLTFYFRARRMRVILRPAREIRHGELFGINAVGFMAIIAFPLRLGELVRPLLLRRRQNVPFSTGLASIAVERLFDGLATLLMLLIGLLGIPAGSHEIPYLGISARTMALTFAAILLPILVLVIVAVLLKGPFLRASGKILRFLPGELGRKVGSGLENFVVGLECLPNFGVFLRLFLESAGVWGAVIIAYEILLTAFGLDLPWTAPFLVLGIACVGISIPAAPGSVGTYQLFVQGALAIYGISKPVGLAYSVVAHAANLLYIGVVGALYLPRMATGFGSLYTDVLDRKEKGGS
ncbi:MAG: lysylphosphatidylglycerol synthase transmembrane domain-containing protein [Pseudomonadota bacterium]